MPSLLYRTDDKTWWIEFRSDKEEEEKSIHGLYSKTKVDKETSLYDVRFASTT